METENNESRRMRLLPVKAKQTTIERAKRRARKLGLSLSAYVRGLVERDLKDAA